MHGKKINKRGKIGPSSGTGGGVDKRAAEEESVERRKTRKVEDTEENGGDENHGRNGETGEPGEKRLRREGGESRRVVEKGIDVDQLDEEEWRNAREELWREKAPLLRISGKDARRARMACTVQAESGEFTKWKVPGGCASQGLRRSMEKSGYRRSELGAQQRRCACGDHQLGRRCGRPQHMNRPSETR